MLLNIINPSYPLFRLQCHVDVYGWLNGIANASDRVCRNPRDAQYVSKVLVDFVDLTEGSEQNLDVIDHNRKGADFDYVMSRLRSFPKKYRTFNQLASIDIDQNIKAYHLTILPHDLRVAWFASQRDRVKRAEEKNSKPIDRQY